MSLLTHLIELEKIEIESTKELVDKVQKMHDISMKPEESNTITESNDKIIDLYYKTIVEKFLGYYGEKVDGVKKINVYTSPMGKRQQDISISLQFGEHIIKNTTSYYIDSNSQEITKRHYDNNFQCEKGIPPEAIILKRQILDIKI